MEEWEFVVDEDMPRSTARLLRSVGCFAEDVRDIDLGRKSDSAILAYAQLHQACVITADLDFVKLVHTRSADIAGLIIVRLPNHFPTWRVNDALLNALHRLAGRSLRDLLITVEASRVRVRRLTAPE